MSWTCERCQVTSRSMEGLPPMELPSGWVDDSAGIFCLGCRRERAADASLDDVPADSSIEDRAQMRRHAIVDFEVGRDPERTNGEIARAIRSSVPSVRKARTRLGLELDD
jgi:hypothetical protein